MRSISINAHAASIDAAVARKEAFAQEVAAAGRRLNVSGFTLDFEDGNGDHIDEWVSLWSTVRDALHAQLRKRERQHGLIHERQRDRAVVPKREVRRREQASESFCRSAGRRPYGLVVRRH